MELFSFNFPSLAATEDEDTPYEFTITPNMALTAGYRVRWEIILDGQLPAGFNDFDALSGVVTFASGATGGETITLPIIDDAARGDLKSFSVRLTQIDAGDQEMQIGTDQAISLTDNDIGEFAHISLSSTGEHDTLVAGSSYTYRSFTGVGGNDTMVITRFQTGDITINDVNGQNIIKLDHGVQITDVDRDIFVIPNGGMTIVNSITITLATGSEITITSPDSGLVGSKRYSFQLGDGALTDYAGFYAAITNGGFKEGDSGPLGKTFVVAYPVAGASTASTDTSTEILFTATLVDAATEDEDTPYEFTITPNAALTAGYRVRWEIILDGQLPAGFNDFDALSGVVTFANGATGGETVTLPIIDDAARGDLKSFSVRLTQIDADDQEAQIGTDQAISLTDNDIGEFAHISLSSTGEHDTLVAGSSYTYRSFTGVGGNDTMVITRFQTGDITINDVNGQNIIKLDHGVQITDVDRDIFVIPNGGMTIVNSITITLATGSEITITSPDSGLVGSKRYSYQLGDGALTDYAGFYAAITNGGFKEGDTGPLGKTFVVAYPNDVEQVDVTFISLEDSTGTLTETDSASATLLTTASITGENPTDYIEFSTSDSRFTFDGTSLRVVEGAAFDFEASDEVNVTVTVTATKDGGVLPISIEFTLTLTNINDVPPVFTDNPTEAVVEGVEIAANAEVYTAFATGDAEAAVTYSLASGRGDDADLFNINANTGVVTIIEATTPDYETDQDGYSFTVIATAGEQVAEHAVTIGITPVDEHAPTISGSFTGDAIVAVEATWTPSGTISLFDDADAFADHRTTMITQTENMVGTYGTLSFVGNTWTYTLDAAGAAARGLNNDEAATETFGITAGAHISRDIVITVTGANDAPVVVIANDQGTAAENADGANIDGIRFTASDADSNDQNYAASDFTIRSSNTDAISHAAVQGLFEVYLVDGTDGAADAVFGVKVQDGQSLDFEDVSSYGLKFTYADSAESDAVTITVTDVNEAPVFTAATASADVDEATEIQPATIIYTAAATPAVSDQAIAYSLEGTDSSLFSIDETGGEVTFAAATTPDYETLTSYSVTVVATAAGGVARQDVTIAVNPVDEHAPELIGAVTGSVIAGADVNTDTGRLRLRNDADSFEAHQTSSIDQTANIVGTYGTLSFVENTWTYTLDNADPDTLALGRGVVDMDVFTITAGPNFTQEITITVTGVNEVPTVAIATNAGTVAEGVASANIANIRFTVSDLDTSDQNYDAAKLTVLSADTSIITHQAVQELFEVYLVSGNGDTSVFGVKLKEGVSFDFETDVTEYGLTFTYDDSTPSSAGLVSALSDTVTITVTNVNDSPPMFTSDASDIAFDEGMSFSLNTLVYTAAATADANAAVVYSLEDLDSDLFVIDADTGAVTFAATTTLDFETTSSYLFTVRATAGDQSSTQSVTVAVTDVVEVSTTIALGTSSASLPEGFFATPHDLTTVALAGTEVEGYVFSLVGDARFELIDGVLRIAAGASFNFEADSGSVFQVTVRAEGPSLITETFSLTLTDANDAPEIIVTSNEVVNILEGIVGRPPQQSDSYQPIVFHVVDEDINAPAVVLSGFNIVSDTSGVNDAEVQAIFNVYEIQSSGGATGTIDDVISFGVRLKTGVSLDFETQRQIYYLRVTYSDGELTSAATPAFTLRLLDRTEGAVLSSSSIAVPLAEGVELDTGTAVYTAIADPRIDGQAVTYSIVGGADASLFTIDSTTGVVTLAEAITPNFAENIDGYTFTVGASAGGETTSHVVVTIAITPTIQTTLYSFTFSSGINVIVEADDVAAQDLTALGIEGGITLDGYVFTISDDRFEIINDMLRIVEGADFDFEDGVTVNVEISGRKIDVTTNALAFGTYTLHLTNVAEAPTITSGGTGLTLIDGDTYLSTDVLYTATANPNPNFPTGAIIYSLAEHSASTIDTQEAQFFTIDSVTGVVTFAENFEADYDQNTDGYNFAVVAAFGGESTHRDVTIAVTPVTEVSFADDSGVLGTPLVDGDTYLDSVILYTATATLHTEGQVIIYSLAEHSTFPAFRDSVAQFFAIDSATGAVTFAQNFEADYDRNNDGYEFAVVATSGGESAHQDVTLDIEPVDEHQPLRITTNSVITGAITVGLGTVVNGLVSLEGDADTNTEHHTILVTPPTDLNGLYGVFSFNDFFWTYTLNSQDSISLTPETVFNDRIEIFNGENGPEYITITVTGENNVVPEISVTISEGTVRESTDGANVDDIRFTVSDQNMGHQNYNAERFTVLSSDPLMMSDTDVQTLFQVYRVEGTGPASVFGVKLREGVNLDFETDITSYGLKFTYRDGLDATSAESDVITITLTNVNEQAPVFTSSAIGAPLNDGLSLTVDTNIYIVEVTGVEADRVITYSLEGDDAGLFTIDDTGILHFAEATEVDFETHPDGYSLTIIASSDGVSTSLELTIAITDRAEAPQFTVGGTSVAADAINGGLVFNTDDVLYTAAATPIISGQAVTYSIDGVDREQFNINSEGEITFAVATTPDYTTNSDGYRFTVIATAGSEETRQTVTIAIIETTNITLSSDASTIDEANEIEAVVLATVTLAGHLIGYTLTTDDMRFAITGTDLTIVQGSNFNYEVDGDTIIVTVTASKDGADDVTATYSLTLTEASPVFISSGIGNPLTDGGLAFTGSVVYTAAVDTSITSVDTFTIEGTDASLFDINSVTGAVSFNTFVFLDHETNLDGYAFTVVATAGGEEARLDVTIAITPVDENGPPVFGGLFGVINIDSDSATASASIVLGDDPDSIPEHRTTVVTPPENLVGTYGSIAFNGNDWTYTLNREDADTIALALNGGGGTEIFRVGTGPQSFHMRDIRITINGPDISATVDRTFEQSNSILGTDNADSYDHSADQSIDGYRYDTGLGDDSVLGSGGRDIFTLGLGADMATGNNGADIFIQQVGVGTNSLTVNDFGFGSDVLTLVDSSANLLGDTFFDLTIGDGVVTAEMLSDGTDITGLTLTIGTDDTITLTFASTSQFAVADIKATLGLAEEVTLSDYFADDAERSETQYVFTQTAFTEAIFDELLGDGGLEILQSAADTPYIV